MLHLQTIDLVGAHPALQGPGGHILPAVQQPGGPPGLPPGAVVQLPAPSQFLVAQPHSWYCWSHIWSPETLGKTRNAERRGNGTRGVGTSEGDAYHESEMWVLNLVVWVL